MFTLFDDRWAFYQEHRRCGDLDGGVEGDRVWMTCSCADLARLLFRKSGTSQSMMREEALDNAPGRVILSRHLHLTEVRHGTAAVDLPQLFQGHLAWRYLHPRLGPIVPPGLQTAPRSEPRGARCALPFLLGARGRRVRAMRQELPHDRTRFGLVQRQRKPVSTVPRRSDRQRASASVQLRDTPGSGPSGSPRSARGCATPRETRWGTRRRRGRPDEKARTRASCPPRSRSARAAAVERVDR